MLDLLQLLAPAELPKVFDVLGDNALENGDFQSVFDSFLNADIQEGLEEELLNINPDELLNEVLETLTSEQASLLMSFLVQVEVALDDPNTELAGLLNKDESSLELESEIPGSAGFALRSLELAVEFSLSKVNSGEWTKEEAKTQLSAYLKHWLKHEPCLNCREPTFFVASELVPAEEFLQKIDADKKVLPQDHKQIDLYLLKTQKSNFKIPFFTSYQVEEVKNTPKPLLQTEEEAKTLEKLATTAEVDPKKLKIDNKALEALKGTEKETTGSKEQKPEGVSELPKNESASESKNVKVSLPQVQTRIDKALNWFAEQMKEIGKPDSMEEKEWSKIIAWMESKRAKSGTEALEQLNRLSRMKEIGSQDSKHSRTLSEFQSPDEEVFNKEVPKDASKSLRFQKALADVYQSVRSEESSEKAQQVLKSYQTSSLTDIEKPTEQKFEMKPQQETNSQQANIGSKTSEVKVEQNLPTQKALPTHSSGWDPELLEKFIQSTKENLKIWVDKKYVAMRIQIEPVELGKIQLKTIVEQGRIGVLIHAENQMTKELLQIHLHEMKEILKEQGLEVAGFQVDVKEQSSGFFEQKSSSGSKFELESLLNDENNVAEISSVQVKGLIDQVA